MLTFDPSIRITVTEALEHPWLQSYHDVADEPECPSTFEKWQAIEELDTLEDFREALWDEIEDYRREVRGIISTDLSGLPIRRMSTTSMKEPEREPGAPEPPSVFEPDVTPESPTAAVVGDDGGEEKTAVDTPAPEKEKEKKEKDLVTEHDEKSLAPPPTSAPRPTTPADPVVTYARRSSIVQPSRQTSTYNSPLASHQRLPSFVEGPMNSEPGSLAGGGIAFPTQSGYVLPARSRTGSTVGGEYMHTRKLLRTLSTVSIHESVEGLAGGLAGIAPIGKYIVEKQTTGADAPPSEMPRDFGIDETDEGQDEDWEKENDGRNEGKFKIH